MKQLQKQNEVKSKLIKYLLLQYGERFNDDLEVKKLKSEIDALESQMSGKEPMITDEEIDTEANKFQLAIYGGKFGFVSGAKWAIGLIHSRQEPTMRDETNLICGSNRDGICTFKDHCSAKRINTPIVYCDLAKFRDFKPGDK